MKSKKMVKKDVLKVVVITQSVAFQGSKTTKEILIHSQARPTLSEILKRAGLTSFGGRVEFQGRSVSRQRLNDITINEDCTVNVVLIPQGGGGDEGGKSIRQTLTSIAIIATASWIAGPILGGHFGLWAGGSVAKGLATTVIASMMSNALIAPQRQNRPNNASNTDPENKSYTITRFRNTPNFNGTYPVVYGKHKLFPPPGAEPYSEIVGNDIYFRQLFTIGYGPIEISDIKIGETAIGSYSDVEYNIKEGWPDDTALSIYTNDIHTTAVDALVVQATPVTRTSQTATTRLSVDVCFKIGLFALSADGRRSQITVEILIEYSIKDADDWSTATTLEVTELSNSVVWRNYSWDVAENQYDVRVTRVTDDYNLYDEFHFYALKSIKASSPVNISGMAMIEVRIKATDQLNGIIDTLSCVAEAVLPVYVGQYTDITAVAATNGWTSVGTNLDTILDVNDYIQISGFTDNDNNCNYRRASGAVMAKVATVSAWAATFTDLVSIANEAAGNTIYIWKLMKTRNPAWAYVDQARGKATLNPLLDTRLSIDKLNTWATNCDTESRYFDFVLEAETTLRQMMDDTAATGRGSFSLLDGKLSIVEDTLQSTVKQMITTRNSWGLKGRKSFIKQPHALRLQFINEDAEYTWDERIVYISGYTSANATEFETIRLIGVTDPDLVWKEGMYRLAVAVHRPEVFTVNMDFERMLIDGRGNLVLVANDSILVGLKAGRVTAVTLDGTDMTHITVDESCTMAEGTDYGVTIRLSDNTYIVSEQIVTNAGAQTTLEFTTPIDTTVDPYPVIGDLFEFGEHESETMRCIVTGIQPKAKDSAVITLTNEGPAVYTSDTGVIPEYTTNITIPAKTQQKIPPVPVLLNIRSDESVMVMQGKKNDWITRVLIAFAPASALGFASLMYEIRWKRSGETQWHKEPAVLAEANEISIFGLEDTVSYDFQVRSCSGVGVASLWDTASGALTAYTVIGKSSDPSDVADLAVSIAGEKIRCTWTKVVDKDVSDYAIRYGGAADSWAAMSATEKRTGDTDTFMLDALLAGTYKIAIKAVDTSENYSDAEDTDSLVISLPSTPANNGTFVDASRVQLRWTECKTSFDLEHYEIKRGDVYASASPVGFSNGTFKSYQEMEPGTYTYWITAIDYAGNRSVSFGIQATTLLPAGIAYQQIISDDLTNTAAQAQRQVIGGKPFLFLPVDITETWAEHFTDNSAATFQDLIDAGYTKYSEPYPTITDGGDGTTSCYYFPNILTWDGSGKPIYALVPGVKIKVDFTKNIISQGAVGLVEIYPWIVISGKDNSDADLLETFPGWYEATISASFKYVDSITVYLYFRCTGKDHLISISDLRSIISYPEKTESGIVTISANPTEVELTKTFANMVAVDMTALGTTAFRPQAHNYSNDETNISFPATFDAYGFDKDDNADTGNAAYTVHGW